MDLLQRLVDLSVDRRIASTDVDRHKTKIATYSL